MTSIKTSPGVQLTHLNKELTGDFILRAHLLEDEAVLVAFGDRVAPWFGGRELQHVHRGAVAQAGADDGTALWKATRGGVMYSEDLVESKSLWRVSRGEASCPQSRRFKRGVVVSILGRVTVTRPKSRGVCADTCSR